MLQTQQDRSTPLHGVDLNRLPHDVANDLVIILNVEEKRKTSTEGGSVRREAGVLNANCRDRRMIFPICPQYTARHEEEGTWSILDTETGEVAVVDHTVTLKRLDEATAMDIVDAVTMDHSVLADIEALSNIPGSR